MRSSVLASFSKAAPGYAHHAVVQRDMADWLAEWLPREREGAALEVGAGTGLFTARAQPWAGRYVATDLSLAMCAQGRSAHGNVEWRVMPAEDPLAGPWQWMFSSSALQWAQRPSDVLSRWRRVLQPGGRILVGVFAEGSLAELRSLAPEVSPLRWRKPVDWRGAVAEAGLELLRDACESRPFRYEDGRAFFRSLHGVGAAPVRRLGPGAMRRLLREYDARHRDARGVGATWVFYRFEARLPG